MNTTRGARILGKARNKALAAIRTREQTMKEEMPRYLITSLLERLQEKYNDGARYIPHDELLVTLMGMILDGEIDTTSSG